MEQTPELTGIMENYSPKNQILPSRNWQWPGLTEGTLMTQRLISYSTGNGRIGRRPNWDTAAGLGDRVG
jgi:hypothetical protein